MSPAPRGPPATSSLSQGTRGTPRQVMNGRAEHVHHYGRHAAAGALTAERRDGARVRQEERGLLPDAGEELVEVVGRGGPAARVDVHHLVDLVEQAEVGMIDHLPFLALLDALDRQTDLLAQLVDRLVEQVGDAGVDPDDRLDHVQRELLRLRLVVHEDLGNVVLALVGPRDLDRQARRARPPPRGCAGGAQPRLRVSSSAWATSSAGSRSRPWAARGERCRHRPSGWRSAGRPGSGPSRRSSRRRRGRRPRAVRRGDRRRRLDLALRDQEEAVARIPLRHDYVARAVLLGLQFRREGVEHLQLGSTEEREVGQLFPVTFTFPPTISTWSFWMSRSTAFRRFTR